MKAGLILLRIFALLFIPLSAFAAGHIATWWDNGVWSNPVTTEFDKSTLPFKTADHIKAVMIKGVDFKGRESRFFCWYGVPDVREGESVPGIVLVHGGRGFAFSRWVELWNKRGYAAIALDTCGNIPRHPWEGRKFKPVRDKQHGATEKEKYLVNIPKEEQWSYQAVANIMLAHSFLRSLPGVDPERIGVTGVSWGGYLTTLVSGVDNRFAFSIPVYGCGFFSGTHFYHSMLKRKRTEADFARWCELWDADKFLSNAKMPVLFVNGTNDFFFHLDSWTKTTKIPSNVYMALNVKMKHSHKQADVPVVYAFADMVTKGKSALPRLISEGVNGKCAYAEFDAPEAVIAARYNYSLDDKHSTKRSWNTVELNVSGKGKIKVEYPIPDKAVIGYFSVFIKNKYVSEEGFADNYGKIPVFSSSRPVMYK